MELIKVFRARVVDVAPDRSSSNFGHLDKIDGLLEVLRPFLACLRMARTGRISMTAAGDLLQPPTVRLNRQTVEAKSK